QHAHQVDHWQGDHDIPGQGHELVEAKARNRPPHQHAKHDEAKHFSDEHDELQDNPGNASQYRDAGKMPAAEEQNDQQETGRDHVRIFAEEKHGEFHGAVFRVIAAHELLL